MSIYKVKIKGHSSDPILEKDQFRILQRDGKHWIVEFNNKIYHTELLDFDPSSKQYSIHVNNQTVDLQLLDSVDLLLEDMGMNEEVIILLDQINAPMPGMIVDVLVSKGDDIQEGDSLLIMEAMKMENVLKASGTGKIKEILIKKGETVEKDQLLIKFE